MSGGSADDTDATGSQAREAAAEEASSVRLATDGNGDDRAAARSSDELARDAQAAPHAAGESARDFGSSARKTGESARDAPPSARPVSSAAREARQATNEAHGIPSEARQATKEVHGIASEARRLASHASHGARPAQKTASEAQGIASDAQKTASEAQKTASDAQKTASEAQGITSDAPAATSGAHVRAGKAHDSERGARKTADDAQGPASEAPVRTREAPVRTDEAEEAANDARPTTPEADASTAAASAPIPLADYRYRVTRTSVTEEAFRAFLARADTRRWVRSIVKAKVPSSVVKDVTHDALIEAVKAYGSAPPSKDEVLVVWIATITRRVVADFLEKRGRRRKYEGKMPRDPARPSLDSAYDTDERQRPIVEPSYDPREGSVDDLELEGGFLFRWLQRQVTDSPMDRETFAIVLEHGLGEKTYQTIADERGITLTVLSSRIFAFRNKYVPRYKRERNRTWLLLLLFGMAVVAVVWLLSRRDENRSGTTRPSTRPVLDGLFGGPLPVGQPRPNDPIGSDAGAERP